MQSIKKNLILGGILAFLIVFSFVYQKVSPREERKNISNYDDCKIVSANVRKVFEGSEEKYPSQIQTKILYKCRDGEFKVKTLEGAWDKEDLIEKNNY